MQNFNAVYTKVKANDFTILDKATGCAVRGVRLAVLEVSHFRHLVALPTRGEEMVKGIKLDSYGEPYLEHLPMAKLENRHGLITEAVAAFNEENISNEVFLDLYPRFLVQDFTA